MKIDSHQHFWKFDPVRDAWIDATMTAIRQDFLPPHVYNELTKHGFTGSVAVQATETHAETEWLLSLAENYGWIQKVVGWADLTSNDLERILEKYVDHQRLAGFRQILQSRPPELLDDSDFRRGIELLGKLDYTYDLLIYPEHLSAANRLVNDFPNQRFVIDHLAKPAIRHGDIATWEAGIRQIAHCENAFCKLSGLVTEADWEKWQIPEIRPYIDIALDTFGAERLMFGSDWPVATLAASFDQAVEVVQSSVQGLTSSEQQMIMGGTACNFYGITQR